MTSQTHVHPPVEISRANQHDVKIRWQDGHESVYPARELRLQCPCATCVDPSTRPEGLAHLVPSTVLGARQDSAPQVSPAGLRELTGHVRIVSTDVAQNVAPLKIDLIGRYAISIQWSDGHQTGIYTFDLLRNMCPCCSDKQQATGDK